MEYTREFRSSFFNNEQWTKERWAIDRMKSIIMRVTERVSKNYCYIRDIVNAKNATSLLLMHFYGGYFIDTTVMPDNERCIQFPEYQHPKYPLHPVNPHDFNNSLQCLKVNKTSWYDGKNSMVIVKDEMGGMIPTNLHGFDKDCFIEINALSGAQPLELSPKIECWLMFSPKNHPISWSALEYYLRYHPILYMFLHNFISQFNTNFLTVPDEVHQRDAVIAMWEFHQNSALAIISSLIYGLYANDKIRITGDSGRIVAAYVWSVCSTNTAGVYLVPDLGIRKKYVNSHKLKQFDFAFLKTLQIKYFYQDGNPPVK